MNTDPIADMIIRLKNAALAGNESLLIPYSVLKHEIAKTLQAAGYVRNLTIQGKKVKKFLGLDLVARPGERAVKGVKRLSRPSRRVYLKTGEIRPVLSGTGTLIMSTPQGIMRGEDARRAGVGGEALFMIW